MNNNIIKMTDKNGKIINVSAKFAEVFEKAGYKRVAEKKSKKKAETEKAEAEQTE